jgi:hypothetical protein
VVPSDDDLGHQWHFETGLSVWDERCAEGVYVGSGLVMSAKMLDDNLWMTRPKLAALFGLWRVDRNGGGHRAEDCPYAK